MLALTLLACAHPAHASTRADFARSTQQAPLPQTPEDVALEAKPDSSLASISKLIDVGHYAEAEAASRKLLAEREARSGPDSAEAAAALDLLVESLWRGGKAKSSEAQQLGERAVRLREKLFGPASPEFAKSLRLLGLVFLGRGDYTAARPIFERELSIEEKVVGPESVDVGKTLSNLGNTYFEVKQYSAARPLYERSVAIEEKALGPNDPLLAIPLNNLASLYREAGDYSNAIKLQERAVAIWEKSLGPEHPTLARGLANLGTLKKNTGDLAGAKALYERALAIQEKVLGPEHPEIAFTLNGMGSLLRGTGDLSGAKKAYVRAIAIQDKAMSPGKPVSAGMAYNLAEVEKEAGDYGGAKQLLEQVLATQEKALGPEDTDVAGTLGRLGNILRDIGDYSGAKALLERSLSIQEKKLGPNHPDVAVALSNLALVLWEMGDDEEGPLRLSERALAIFEKALGPNSGSVAQELHTIGVLYDSFGEFAKARAYEERALAIREKAYGPDSLAVAKTLAMLGITARELGDYSAAKSYFDRALPIGQKLLGENNTELSSLLQGYSHVLWALSDKQGALRAALQADRIAEEVLRLTASTLPEQEALGYESKARIRLYRALGYAAETSDLSPEARREVWNAVIRSRALIFDEMAARHRSIVSSENPELIRLASEFSSAQQRLAALVIRGPGSQRPERYRKLLDETRREKQNAETSLAEKSAEFRQNQARSKIGFSEVAAALPADSALVAFVRYVTIERKHELPGKPSRHQEVPAYLAFVLRGGQTEPRIVPLGPAGEIENLAARWRKELAVEAMAPGRATKLTEISYRNAATQLRRRVWEPIAVYLAGAKRMFVVPDGVIDLVNFYALPVGRSRYLIETGPIIHYISAERDLVPPTQPTKGKGLLVVGAPAFDDKSRFANLSPQPRAPVEVQAASFSSAGSFRGHNSTCGDFRTMRFDSLPASAQEVKEISVLWRERPTSHIASDTVLPLLGPQAYEEAFKSEAPGKQVLHLATHGFFLGSECYPMPQAAPADTEQEETKAVSGENPLLLSGLAFAGANYRDAARPEEDDGILTAEEIAAMDLKGVQWVVLSGCDTGLGKVAPGEGVLGLQRAFQLAGVQSVIMSLWPVQDTDAREWMATLYRERFRSGLDTAGAIRQADLELFRKRRAKQLSTHPFYWAAFVATGDWR